MPTRSLLAALALIFAAPVLAQTAPPSPTPAARPPVRVAITTSEGAITVELDREHAPITSANFLKYVDGRRFDGVTFYRAVSVVKDPPLGFIQGGVQNAPARVLPPIKHEATTETGLSHTDGALSMPRLAPGSASGDFFIVVGDLSASMDANPKNPGDNAGFAVFAHVTDGMDVVRRIMALPTSATAGAGVMKGSMLAAPVRIVTARRLP